MERIAAENGIEIEFVRSKKSFRKEDRVKEILRQRGEQAGVVCLLSAMEPCGSYKPWHDKKTGKTYLKPDDGKCLHYYVYFMDEELGLCSLRVPTWSPFRLQFYCNGHSVLARRMTGRKIEYRVLDNAFGWIAVFETAQQTSQRVPGRETASETGCLRRPLLSSSKAIRARLPLEPGSGGVRQDRKSVV